VHGAVQHGGVKGMKGSLRRCVSFSFSLSLFPSICRGAVFSMGKKLHLLAGSPTRKRPGNWFPPFAFLAASILGPRSAGPPSPASRRVASCREDAGPYGPLTSTKGLSNAPPFPWHAAARMSRSKPFRVYASSTDGGRTRIRRVPSGSSSRIPLRDSV